MSEKTEVKKDKEWLRAEVERLHVYGDSRVRLVEVSDLIDQLDEPEALSQELPTIPKFVAEHIDKWKKSNVSLSYALSALRDELTHFRGSDEQTKMWLYHAVDGVENQELFARAWLDGYEVAEEREQKYYVDLDTAAYVCKWKGNGKVQIYDSSVSNNDDYIKELTEEEIKGYDPRFWAFRKPVEELEN